MNDKPAGWYYVGDGKLRYRDDYDWTDFYMETTDPRTMDWPPSAPQTLLHELREEEARRALAVPSKRTLKWVRHRASGASR